MAVKHKCALCDSYIENSSDEIPYKKRYVHKTCFQASLKNIKKNKDNKLAEKTKEKKSTPKPKAELKEAVTEEGYAEKKKYYQYLRKLLDDELDVKIYALSDHYVSRYNFTFNDMYQTLVYINEIIEKELIGDIVGLIPYYYSEAKAYYESVDKVKENNKDANISEMYKQKTIYIKPKKRSVKQLDIESIGDNNGC